MSRYNIILNTKVLAHRWWGQQWCQNIENYADFSNRLERGRAYLRAGRVYDLEIEKGMISAKVDGSMEYVVAIKVEPLPQKEAEALIKKISDLNAFKDGYVPEDYKFLFSIEEGGIFPRNHEISVGCSCPDVANLCKHIAAVLYAVGCILDQEPLLLFELRGIDVDAYLDAEIREKTNDLLVCAKNFSDEDRLIEDDLISEIFGIDLGEVKPSERKHCEKYAVEPVKQKTRTIVVNPAPKVYKPRVKEKKKLEKVLAPDRMVIRQYELDGSFVAQFENYDEAEKVTGIAKRTMQRNVCGEKKSGGGYVWQKAPANTAFDDIDPLVYDSDTMKKSVVQYSYDGIKLAEYSSIKEAARESGVNLDGIRRAVRGWQKQAGGFIWEYKDNGQQNKTFSTRKGIELPEENAFSTEVDADSEIIVEEPSLIKIDSEDTVAEESYEDDVHELAEQADKRIASLLETFSRFFRKKQ